MSNSGNCEIYRDPSKPTFVASVLIAFGIVLSYLPQYYNIYKTKTSIGLSPKFLLLISIAGVSATANLVLLSFLSIPCCTELTRFECANSQISLIQVGLQSSSTLLITWVCVRITNTVENQHHYGEILRTWREIQLWVGGIIVTLIAAYFLFSDSSILLYAKILGLISTTITIVQYIPQLYTTYILKRSGVLSVLMMIIQTPGGFVWTATLILKPGAHWSSWLPYLTAAIFQGLLLIMSLYYDHVYKGEKPLLSDNDVVPSYQSSLT